MDNKTQGIKDYNKILNLFDPTDIKYNEEEQIDDEIQMYSNIKNINNEYSDIFNDLIKDYTKNELNEYIKYTDYGYILINNNEPDYITVMVSIYDENYEDEEELDESLVSIKNEDLFGHYDEIEDDGDYDAPYIPNQEPITYKGFDIYKGVNEYDDETYYIFFKDDPFPEPGYEDWYTDTLEEAKEWCDSYYEDEDDDDEYEDDEYNESLIPIEQLYK